MPRFTSIQLTGLDRESRQQGGKDYVVIYGYRVDDTAHRVVGVAVTEQDARDVMSQANYIGTMPAIEVDDRHWFYVATLGKAFFEKGKEPRGA